MISEPSYLPSGDESDRKGAKAAVVIKLATLGLMLLVLNSGLMSRATFAQSDTSGISPIMMSLVRGI